MNFTRKILGSLLFAGSLALVGCGDPVSSAAPLVTGEHGIKAIAVDDFFVYWATQDGSVKRVSRDGGKATTLVSGQQSPSTIAVDGTHVYWSGEDGTIARTAKEGGTADVLAQAGHKSWLAIDPTHVYFTTAAGTVQKRSKVDESMADLATDQKVAEQFALNGTTLLWADSNAAVHELATSSGSADPLVPAQKQPQLTAISSTNVYWSNTGDVTKGENTVGVARRDGSGVRLIAPTSASFASAVMGDDAFVYFGDLNGGVNVAPIEGGEATQLAQGPAGKVVMAMDSSSIYWAHSSGGTIFTAPRQ
jgi:hypothetical protein